MKGIIIYAFAFYGAWKLGQVLARFVDGLLVEKFRSSKWYR